MDLGSHLANLSLAEIASFLNTKQQEVLLASISVAARFIQQLQADEQQRQQEDLQAAAAVAAAAAAVPGALQSSITTTSNNHNNNTSATSLSHTSAHNLNINNISNISNLNTTSFDNHDMTEQDDDDEDDQHVNDQSSDISFEDYQCPSQPDHSSPADKQTLQVIREFAEELKHRRKSIRLSQKGAAQSLRAFTGGEQPCTDAIIYHFENLQLEPDRAMQLIPLLRDWLEWAEKHRLNGRQLPVMCAVSKVPRERKRKVVLFNEKARQYLEDAFAKNNHPDRYQLDVISQELNIPTRSIRKWFTNRRQRKRFHGKYSPLQ